MENSTGRMIMPKNWLKKVSYYGAKCRFSRIREHGGKKLSTCAYTSPFANLPPLEEGLLALHRMLKSSCCDLELPIVQALVTDKSPRIQINVAVTVEVSTQFPLNAAFSTTDQPESRLRRGTAPPEVQDYRTENRVDVPSLVLLD